MNESFSRLSAWARAHPYIAGALVLLVVVLAYITVKKKGTGSGEGLGFPGSTGEALPFSGGVGGGGGGYGGGTVPPGGATPAPGVPANTPAAGVPGGGIFTQIYRNRTIMETSTRRAVLFNGFTRIFEKGPDGIWRLAKAFKGPKKGRNDSDWVEMVQDILTGNNGTYAAGSAVSSSNLSGLQPAATPAATPAPTSGPGTPSIPYLPTSGPKAKKHRKKKVKPAATTPTPAPAPTAEIPSNPETTAANATP